MTPQTIEELDKIKTEAKNMVIKRAVFSGATAAIHIPGVDIATDISIMVELLPAINKKFGLSKEQLEELNPEMKKQVLVLLTSLGSEIGKKVIGKTVSKELVTILMKKSTTKIATKQVTRFVPFIGPVISASVSFTAMCYLGNSHVEDCYNVCKNVLIENRKKVED